MQGLHGITVNDAFDLHCTSWWVLINFFNINDIITTNMTIVWLNYIARGVRISSRYYMSFQPSLLLLMCHEIYSTKKQLSF